jgi:hypothetical protein
MGDIKTYLNKNKTPILRKCGNCANFKIIEENNINGYCKIMPLLFAFTHEKSVYAIVKDFYLCEKHILFNEEILKMESIEVDLLPYLAERNKSNKHG